MKLTKERITAMEYAIIFVMAVAVILDAEFKNDKRDLKELDERMNRQFQEALSAFSHYHATNGYNWNQSRRQERAAESAGLP